jgi:acyl carrier protein
MLKNKQGPKLNINENNDKKNVKQTKDDLEDYMLQIIEKYTKQNINKNINKNNFKRDNMMSGDIDIPTFSQYNLILDVKYNVPQLKTIAKHYKIKFNGNKHELISRIHSYLFLSMHILKIQRTFRIFIQKKYNKCHGPAIMKRELCNNPCDFFTMDELKDIPFDQFFSYKDTDGFIYGFDIVSMHNLIYSCNGIIQNPYNRIPISSEIIENFKNLIKLSKILRIDVCTEITNIEDEISNEKIIELKIIEIFQTIDSLGNYSNPQWFLSLSISQLIRFFRELADIWTEVLKLKQVGINDNFFELGGHSLLATQVISRLREVFSLDFSLRYLFENPTIAELAQKVIEQQIEQVENDDLARILAEVDQLSEEEVTQQLML